MRIRGLEMLVFREILRAYLMDDHFFETGFRGKKIAKTKFELQTKLNVIMLDLITFCI